VAVATQDSAADPRPTITPLVKDHFKDHSMAYDEICGSMFYSKGFNDKETALAE
jgi:hypothetical protein